MTVYSESHHRVVMQIHDGSAPVRPAIPYRYLGSETDVLTVSPDRKRTFHFYDPLDVVSTPSEPPAHGGILNEYDYRIVRMIHDGSAPTEPVLADMYLRKITVTLSASPDRKLTLYFYDPENVAGQDFFLLLENADRFLLESGDRLILE